MILFIEMIEVARLLPNNTTMASVMLACVQCEAFSSKESIHGYAVKLGFEENRYVQNALMDMYSRTGKIDISVNIFDSMVTGYVLSRRHSDALVLLHEMQRVKNNKTRRKNHDDEDENGGFYKPNSITLMTFLPGCATLAALAKGKEIHAYAVRNALESDVTVGSSLRLCRRLTWSSRSTGGSL